LAVKFFKPAGNLLVKVIDVCRKKGIITASHLPPHLYPLPPIGGEERVRGQIRLHGFSISFAKLNYSKEKPTQGVTVISRRNP
jgi:hypothetical protein